MPKQRLDQELVQRGLVSTRSQAESFIKLGKVLVDGRVVSKAGTLVDADYDIKLTITEQYVSRAGLKLASVAALLGLDFRDKVVLDVGSSTGGFTDYALQHGAQRVVAVEVGTNQLHPSLHGDSRIELHEKTDVRDLTLKKQQPGKITIEAPNIVVADVSFVSLRDILPHVSQLMTHDSILVAMVKPQFEAAQENLKHKGVIKNDRMRRQILQGFELWSRRYFVIRAKADSDVAGAKGNRERFYLLQKI
jgi:23S rRNA (cytidine1920-2'-O)/16S rRNA (cytidine1409-2'-O)-methyltransferase